MGAGGKSQAPFIPQGHLDWAEVSALILIYIITKAFLVFPERMSVAAQTAAWTVPLISAAISAIWIWALVSVMRAHPGQDVISITRALAGPVAAAVAGSAFFVYTVGIVATAAREIADALVTVILPFTPVEFMLCLMYFAATFIASRGLETLARICLASVVVVVGLIAALLLLSLNLWRLDSILPVLGPGIGKLARVYGVRQAIYGEVMSLGVFASYLRKPRDCGRAATWALLTSAVTLSLVVVNCQMLFPYPSLNQIPTPLLRVTRLIYLGRFFQRFDAVLVPVWLAAGVLKMAVGIMMAALVLGSTLSLKSLKLLIPLSVGLSFAVSWLLPSFGVTIVMDFDIIRPYSVILLDTWAPALFVLDFVKRRKSQKGRKQG